MINLDLIATLLPVLFFAAVAGAVWAAGHVLSAHAQVQRRLPVAAHGTDLPVGTAFRNLHAFVAGRVDPKRFGLEGAARDKLRLELQRAGYFRAYAVNYYVLARLVTITALPLSTLIIVQLALGEASAIAKIALLS